SRSNISSSSDSRSRVEAIMPFGVTTTQRPTLSLDLFDRPESRQRRPAYYPIDVAVTLHMDIAIAGVADPPVPQTRPRRLRGRNRSLIFAQGDGDRWGGTWE